MRFTSLDAAEKWLASIEGWFETQAAASDDDQGIVTANKRVCGELISRHGYFQSSLTGEARRQAIDAARVEACKRLSAYLNGEE